MDINTPRGQRSLEEERKAIARFSAAFPQYEWVSTPKGKPALLDGLFYTHKEGAVNGRTERVLAAVVEVKARWQTRDGFREEFHDEWLISEDKLTHGQRASELLGVPFVGFLWCVPDAHLCVVPFTDSKGKFKFPFEVKQTRTQETINGGEAIRRNAFINLKNAKEVK